MFEKIETGIAPSSSPVSGEIVAGDIEVQTRRTIANLEIGIRAAGGTLADIVQVQVFLVDRADAAGMNRAYADFFKQPYPVRATVVVKELLAEGLKVEMLATAVVG